MSVWAADSGKTLLEIAAFEIGANHFGDDRVVEAILLAKSLIIYLFEMIKMVL